MATIFSRVTNLTTARRSSSRDEVYVAAVPLRAPKGAGQLFVSSLYSLDFFDFQHFMVILNPSSSSSSPGGSQAVVYDFQPQDPEDLFTAVAALTGRKIPGIVLTRKIKNLPRRKCWFAGYSKLQESSAVNAAKEFNEQWDTDLRIGYHDCRNYVDELVKHLTGEVLVLDQLRKGHSIVAPNFQ